MKRVITYIDGFNLYFGLRDKGWKRFYWLNLRQVALHLLRPYQTLATTKYFTSIVTAPPDKNRRQATFLEALGTLPDFSIYYGHYRAVTVTCKSCGHTYTTHREKMTDVNIATEMLSDAFTDQFDTALLISADSDFATNLALSGKVTPSLILLRSADKLTPVQQSALLIANMVTMIPELEAGAVVSLSPTHLRSRLLPLRD